MNSEVGEQAIAQKVAALVHSDGQTQRQYLQDLLTRWDVLKKVLLTDMVFIKHSSH